MKLYGTVRTADSLMDKPKQQAVRQERMHRHVREYRRKRIRICGESES